MAVDWVPQNIIQKPPMPLSLSSSSSSSSSSTGAPHWKRQVSANKWCRNLATGGGDEAKTMWNIIIIIANGNYILALVFMVRSNISYYAMCFDVRCAMCLCVPVGPNEEANRKRKILVCVDWIIVDARASHINQIMCHARPASIRIRCSYRMCSTCKQQ